MRKYVNVRPLDAPYHIDKPYTYHIDDEATLDNPISVGSLVCVPFGRSTRTRYGVVCGFEAPDADVRTKPIISVLPERYSLSEEMLGLCYFLREHTLCSVGDAVHAMIPAPVFSPTGPRNLNLERRYAISLSREAICELVDGRGVEGIKPLRSSTHRQILSALLSGEKLQSELEKETGATTSQLSSLVQKGIITYTEQEIIRNPYSDIPVTDTEEIVLNTSQHSAYETLCDLYDEDKANCALLYGVTGSGKTKVIMKMIDKTLAEGRGVIMMVPEISLTPQTVGIFCRRYGDRVAVIHSSLSEGERFDGWRRIADGRADLVIGTRSAVFAPLKNPGLFVIDEEHEHTYKSDMAPKYHTRDVAAYRAGKNNSLVLLASATPSVESFYRAKRGIYTLVELRHRYGNFSLPECEVVDMREEMKNGNTSIISAPLAHHLNETMQRGEQAIVFLNRRGYNSFLNCKECGHVITCPHCSVSLTFHSGGGGYLMCHLCGYRESPVRVCPECSSKHISYSGTGTQKAESEICSFVGDASVMRMDADTASGKQAYDRMLGDFRAHRYDVLLGTQMVAKGHDFPDVTLVGVLLADTSLYVSDFRASERTFSLLTQVIGRAGRAKAGGKAIIQTYAPDNDVIGLACKQDYDSFYEREIQLRRALSFPPFCDMVQLTLTASDELLLMREARALSDECVALAKSEYAEQPMVIFGPFEAQTYKVLEKYRMRMIIKCRLNSRTREYFSRLMCKYADKKDITLSSDFNPTSI